MAFITDASTVRDILAHLGEPTGRANVRSPKAAVRHDGFRMRLSKSALGYRTPVEFAAAHRYHANAWATEDSH